MSGGIISQLNERRAKEGKNMVCRPTRGSGLALNEPPVARTKAQMERAESNWMLIQRNEKAIDRWCIENKTTRELCGLTSAQILGKIKTDKV